MNFNDLAKQRSSIRNYEKTPIEEGIIKQLLATARLAPTAANTQPQKIMVINESDSISKVNKAANCHGAPLIMIVLVNKTATWIRPYDNKNMSDIDGTIVADHIVMQAEDLGLSSCWITYFNPSILKREFNIPNEFEPIAIISIGYSTVSKNASRHNTLRKPLESMVIYNHF